MSSSNCSPRIVPVKGFEGYYVGDDGTIWSNRKLGGVLYRNGCRITCRGETKKLSLAKGSDGYPRVDLYLFCKRTYFPVHRLVLEAFVGSCPEGMEACHYDGDRTNNNLSNLRWDTPINNAADRIRHGTSARKLNSKKVWSIRILAKQGMSLTKLSRRYGVGITAIWSIVNRKTWKHVE